MVYLWVITNDITHHDQALFEKSVSTILSINPGLKPSLLEYMIGKSLGLSVKEISVLFAGMVQRNFNPSLDAIS